MASERIITPLVETRFWGHLGNQYRGGFRALKGVSSCHIYPPIVHASLVFLRLGDEVGEPPFDFRDAVKMTPNYLNGH